MVAVGWVGRLPSDRLEWRDGRWWEIRLAAGDDGDLTELPVPSTGTGPPGRTGCPGPETEPLRRSDGARYAVLTAAVDWLAGALRMAPDPAG